jgi:hypothetical protein
MCTTPRDPLPLPQEVIRWPLHPHYGAPHSAPHVHHPHACTTAALQHGSSTGAPQRRSAGAAQHCSSGVKQLRPAPVSSRQAASYWPQRTASQLKA